MIALSPRQQKCKGRFSILFTTTKQARQKSVRARHFALAKPLASPLSEIDLVGRIRLIPVPKEQPPRKLSGQWTSKVPVGLWREAVSLAEGITISGKGTEGA
jgi:hypothetical protein